MGTPELQTTKKSRTSVHIGGADLKDGDQAAGLRPVTRGPPYRGRGNPEVIPLPSPRQPTLLRGDKHPLLRTMALEVLTCRK